MKEKMDVKTYAFAISSPEIFCAGIEDRLQKLDQVLAIKGFVGVHPGGAMQYFLFLSPALRDQACEQARKRGFAAVPVLNPVYIDIEDLQGRKKA